MHEGPYSHSLAVALRLAKLPERDPLLLIWRQVPYKRFCFFRCFFKYPELFFVFLIKLKLIFFAKFFLFV